ncbi:hypothetical protein YASMINEVIRUS_941 [Yasminevirus sp. GU-2018]|uniref:Uncharacterized protein n=1 Tax=Yasminevirus sp. GU-2018 TaxID=2420051 RepID=A0A5K0U8S9_9VIRU|nr:hypothetical protein YASMINEVIRUS_941 [Yasminevirus sp. GU-2018]
MLLDYLCKIQDIIFNDKSRTYGALNRVDSSKIYNPSSVRLIINANDNVVKILRSRGVSGVQFSPKYQIGSGVDELTPLVTKLKDDIKGVLSKSSDVLSTTGAHGKLRYDKFKEIAEVSIALITFLGEMIEINNDNDLKKIQEQIVEINEALTAYL